MKKFRIFLIIAITALFNYSCEDDKDIAVLDNEKAIPAELITPADGSAYVLKVEEGEADFAEFTWSAANYGPTLSVGYYLQYDAASADFLKPVKFPKNIELSHIMTNAEVNLMLYNAGLTTKSFSYFRVLSIVADNPTVDTLYSAANELEITPFIYEKPDFTSPVDGSAMVLVIEDSAKIETFVWNAVDYGAPFFKSYSLEYDLAGNAFKKPVKLGSVKTEEFKISVQELNKILVKNKILPGVTTKIEYRVTATASNKSGIVIGGIISQDVTTYEAAPIVPSEILSPAAGDYILESDPDHVIPFEEFKWTAVNFGSGKTSSYVLEFVKSGSSFDDAVELYAGELTSFTPTMFEMNNLMLSNGFEAGVAADVEVRVRAKAAGADEVTSAIKTYNITTYEAAIVLPPLYLVGNATLAGWNQNAGIEITWDAVNQEYSTITAFTAGGMKILEVSGQWAPQWGDDGTHTGKLTYRPDEATADPAEITSPGVGSYKIRVDIVNLTYAFEAQ